MTIEEYETLGKERQAAQDAIEAIFDRYQWSAVIEMLANICNEKAEHLRTNWQDKHTARRYETAARAFQRIADPLREK